MFPGEPLRGLQQFKDNTHNVYNITRIVINPYLALVKFWKKFNRNMELC